MSIIIAAKIEDRVVLIGDSAETSGEIVTTLTEPERFKVLRLGDVLVGSAGSVKNIRRLAEHPEWFDTKGEEFDKKFIVTKIIPNLFEELLKYKMLDTKGDNPQNSASVVMACKNRIFCLDRNLSVYEADKFAAVGCTKSLLHPFLSEMKEGEEFDTMLAMMRLSSEMSPGVRPPYHYVDTVSFEYKTIEE